MASASRSNLKAGYPQGPASMRLEVLNEPLPCEGSREQSSCRAIQPGVTNSEPGPMSKLLFSSDMVAA